MIQEMIWLRHGLLFILTEGAQMGMIPFNMTKSPNFVTIIIVILIYPF